MAALKIATFANPLGLKQCALRNLEPRSLCPLPGRDAELLFALLASLALPYKLIPSDRELGHYKDGHWHDGLFQMLETGSIDSIAVLFVDTKNRRGNFSLTFPVLDLNLIFITSGPEHTLVGNAALLLKVFSDNVWLALVFCSSLLILGRASLGLWRRHTVTFFFGASSGLLAIIVGAMSVLFLNLYAGGLLTQLLHPTVSAPVRDVLHMVQLLKHGNIKLILWSPNTFAAETISNSDEHFYEQLREALEDNPVVYEQDSALAIQKVKTGSYVLGTTDDYLLHYKSYECNLQALQHTHSIVRFNYPRGFMFRKNFSKMPELNRALISLQGHTANVVTKYESFLEEKIKCVVDKDTKMAPLPLISMSGAFLCMIGVAGTAAFCLVFECLLAVLKPRPKLNIHRSYYKAEMLSKSESAKSDSGISALSDRRNSV